MRRGPRTELAPTSRKPVSKRQGGDPQQPLQMLSPHPTTKPLALHRTYGLPESIPTLQTSRQYCAGPTPDSANLPPSASRMICTPELVPTTSATPSRHSPRDSRRPEPFRRFSVVASPSSRGQSRSYPISRFVECSTSLSKAWRFADHINPRCGLSAVIRLPNIRQDGKSCQRAGGSLSESIGICP
jgi:hypothetical protein